MMSVVACVYVGIAVTRVVQGGITTRDALMSAKTHIADADFSAAQVDLSTAADGVGEAKAGAAMVGIVSYIPWIGERYDAAVGMLDATKNTIDVLVEAVAIAHDVYGVVNEARTTLSCKDPQYANVAIHDLPTSVKRALFVRLADALPDLQKCRSSSLAVTISSISAFKKWKPFVTRRSLYGGGRAENVRRFWCHLRELPEFAGPAASGFCSCS